MSHRLTKEELEAQFEQFMKEPVSDDSLDCGGPSKKLVTKSSQESALKTAASWWQDDQQSSGDTEQETTKRRFLKAKKFQVEENQGFSGLGKTFKKPLRMTQPIREEDEYPGYSSLEAAVISRDNTETDVAPAVKRSSVGLDTLEEEEEEKAQFFSRLEAGASSTIDYSKLNRELESTSSTSDLRKAEQQSDEAGVPENSRPSPGSPHYSQDFEEEEIVKEVEEDEKEKPQVSSILARVSLHDSLDDAGGEERRKDSAASVDKGQSYVQSGGSEMEALQEAYQQIHRAEAASPPPSPPHAQQALQPAFTTDSEFPTAEELMKLIRPEDDPTRGFTLRPLSSVGLDQDETARPLGKTFREESRPEKSLWHGGGGAPSHRSSSPEPLSRELTWSIKQEVERLMQDQSKSLQTLTHVGRAQKQRPSPVPPPSSTSVIKAGVRGQTVDRRPAAPSQKKQSRVSPRVLQQPQRAKSSVSRDAQQGAGDDGLRASSELVVSVQSLVSVLQQQMDAAHPINPSGSRGTCHPLPGSRDTLEDLRVQLAVKEEELQKLRGGAEEELHSLRQQNFMLLSKLRSAEEERRRQRLQAANPAAEEKLQLMDREIRDQETLIRGYQQENEKLCQQMKAQQARNKMNEEAMFMENQKLLTDLVSAREQLKNSWRPPGSLCLLDHTQRIAKLLAQIQTLQTQEAKLSQELHGLRAENRALKVELQLMQKEKELARVWTASGDQSSEIHAMEVQHREEVEGLKKKYTENQELLERDAGRLKAASAEILQLREQVEKLKSEVGRKSSERQRRSRVTSADSRRVQELQKQVKEMERILRSRNPSSLPALIYAAAEAEGASASSGRVTALLEHRIQRLEAELESHDEDAKCSLRSMEQQFERIKLRYEQEISDLEQRLLKQQLQEEEATAAAGSGSGSELWTSKLQAAEEKLELEKQKHRETEERLQEQLESLQEQLKHKPQPSPSRHQRHAQEAFASRLERLNQELSAKTRSVQELQRTVERLQKERRNMLSRSRRAPSPPAAPKDTFPSVQYDKTYQPMVFAGSHISEVVQEKEDLQQQVDQEKEARRAEAQRAEEELRRMKEQIVSMKAEHLRAVEQLQTAHALQYSSSKVAELSNQLSAQEVTVEHLQGQLKELQGAREALTVSRTREEVLQEQLSRLTQQLHEATDAQSPEAKLLCGLEKKIISMELRQQQREEELHQVIGGSRQMLPDHQSEAERWRRVAQEKSREMEAFRLELDSILDILRHLQRQRGVLHAPPSKPQMS
ncbi:unnamed protein product [Ophioblennius macclurei]